MKKKNCFKMLSYFLSQLSENISKERPASSASSSSAKSENNNKKDNGKAAGSNFHVWSTTGKLLLRICSDSKHT